MSEALTGLLVAAGAGVGAPVRYLAGRWLDRRGGQRLHWGTLAVNLVGSFVLGLLVASGLGGDPMALLGTGFCGALTTYSSFAVQSVGLDARLGAAYVVVTVGGCLALAALGYLLTG